MRIGDWSSAVCSSDLVGQRICGRGETAITDPCLVEVSQNRNANEISKRFRQHGERDTVIIMRAIAQPEAARAQFHWAACLVPAQFLRVLLLGVVVAENRTVPSRWTLYVAIIIVF